MNATTATNASSSDQILTYITNVLSSLIRFDFRASFRPAIIAKQNPVRTYLWFYFFLLRVSLIVRRLKAILNKHHTINTTIFNNNDLRSTEKLEFILN